MQRWAVGGIILVIAHVAVAAPQRILHGEVVDELTGEPVAGANVTSQHGTIATGEDGTFSIALAADDTELFVTAPGYVLRRVALGDAPRLRITLTAAHEVIEVTGTAPRAPRPPDPEPAPSVPDIGPVAQSYALTSDDLRALPGTANDALRAAQILPGVARLPYSFGGIVLRGASPRDSVVYLDGIEVPIAFHFGGVTSFYPSGMLEDLEITNTGIEAAYGRAMGGMVAMRSREPRTDRWRTGGSVGLLDSSVYAEGPTRGGGILLGVRRSYFDIVAAPFAADDTPVPSYWDAQIRTSFGDPARHGRIKPMLFFALDHMTRTQPGRDQFEDETSLTSMFVRVAMPYERTWGPTALRLTPWLGVNHLAFRSRVSGVVEHFRRPVFPGGLRSELMRETAWGHVRGGLDLQGGYITHYQAGLGHSGDILVQQNGETSIQWADLAGWVEMRRDFGKLSVKPGLRVERYGLSDENVVDPRVSLTYQLTDAFRLRHTVGRYHQPPTPGDIDPNGGNPALLASYSDAASLGVEGDLADGWWTSVTGYFSRGERLGVRLQDGMQDFTMLGGLGPTFSLLLEKQLGLAFFRENVGRARNYGAELLLRRTTPRWMGLVAYTLAMAERHDGPDSLLGWRPFELDQRHNLNIAGSLTFGAWRVGARLQFVTGIPYSPTLGIDRDGNPVFDPYASRLPAFVQFDVRADRVWKRCWGTIDLYFDIQNATNRRNIEGRQPDDFGVDGDIRGLPIMPFIGLEFIPD